MKFKSLFQDQVGGFEKKIHTYLQYIAICKRLIRTFPLDLWLCYRYTNKMYYTFLLKLGMPFYNGVYLK